MSHVPIKVRVYVSLGETHAECSWREVLSGLGGGRRRMNNLHSFSDDIRLYSLTPLLATVYKLF